MAYLNLAVEITALPDDKYRIAVKSPIGESSADIASPFSPEDLANFLQVLSREKPVSKPVEANTARDFGGRLFDFVFRASPEINSAYTASLRESSDSDGVRIRLTVERAGALSGIPWEYLRDPANDYLALSRRTPVVRYTQQLDTRPASKIKMPLRVLVAISAPMDFPTLDVEGEWQRLQEATAPLREQGLLELERLESATLIALQRRLRAADYHVFHFVGHSAFDAGSQQGYLIFVNEADNDNGQIISGTALSRELAEENSVRLVVLNSCHSANRAPADTLAGISSSLVTRGIPAVVGMQFVITDNAAKAFAEEFYRALSELLPLDAAMSEGRRAITNRVGNNEWATPVLYMRSDSGVLFTSSMRPVPKEAEQEAVQEAVQETPPRRRLTTREIAWSGFAIAALIVLFFVAAPLIFQPAAPTPTPTPSTLPDLQIGRVIVSPRNPTPGQLFTVSITITNVGDAPSGRFSWRWDASQSNPVLQNSLDGVIENIPPGASRNIGPVYNYGWWGRYVTRLEVDADSQVVERNERNNSLPFDIQTSLEPFVMDFTRLPNKDPVEPPMTLTAETFSAWNLEFRLNTSSNPACAETPLLLVEQGANLFLTAGGDIAVCKSLPVSILILKEPVSQAVLQLLPAASGNVTFTYYGNPEGTQSIFQSPAVAVTAGAQIDLKPGDTNLRDIRRIDVSAANQVVQLIGLTLSAPRNLLD
jgi:hypothetical protein